MGAPDKAKLKDVLLPLQMVAPPDKVAAAAQTHNGFAGESTVTVPEPELFPAQFTSFTAETKYVAVEAGETFTE